MFSRDDVLLLLLLNFLDLCLAVGGIADVAGAVNIADIFDVIDGGNV